MVSGSADASLKISIDEATIYVGPLTHLAKLMAEHTVVPASLPKRLDSAMKEFCSRLEVAEQGIKRSRQTSDSDESPSSRRRVDFRSPPVAAGASGAGPSGLGRFSSSIPPVAAPSSRAGSSQPSAAPTKTPLLVNPTGSAMRSSKPEVSFLLRGTLKVQGSCEMCCTRIGYDLSDECLLNEDCENSLPPFFFYLIYCSA